MPTPWWIAGGWALDLHLGRHTRAHDDIDVLVPRRDLAGFHHRLRTWDLHAADPPGVLRPWHLGETLPRTVHDIWCRPEPGSPWALQLMVDDTADDEWVYRRHPCIRRPVCQLAGPASNGTRLVLAPEVQLLYKSHPLLSKDDADFCNIVGSLERHGRDWLRAALFLVAPGHA